MSRFSSTDYLIIAGVIVFFVLIALIYDKWLKNNRLEYYQELNTWSRKFNNKYWQIYAIVSLSVLFGIYAYGGSSFVSSYGRQLFIVWGLTLLPFFYMRRKMLKEVPQPIKRWWLWTTALYIGLLVGLGFGVLYFYFL
jgi:hypothetical protein